MSPFLIGALAMGLFGNVHCLAMCGPLALSINPSRNSGWHALVHHMGRIATYALLGLIAGSIGYTVSWAGFQQVVSLTLGCLLALHGFMLLIGKGGLLQHAHLILPSSFVQRSMKAMWGSEKLTARFGMGMLNGLLPCGLVYLALAASATSTSIWDGVAFMTLFGLATLPVFAFLEFFKQKFKPKVSVILPRMVPYLFLVFGVLLILRGADLGIPYLSPVVTVEGGMGSCCAAH